jgi:hypothetical protein
VVDHPLGLKKCLARPEYWGPSQQAKNMPKNEYMQNNNWEFMAHAVRPKGNQYEIIFLVKWEAEQNIVFQNYVLAVYNKELKTVYIMSAP